MRMGSLVAEFAVTVLGAGHAPVAPGTAGAAVGLALALGTGRIAGRPGIAAGAAFLSAVSLALSPWAIRRFDSSDPRPFVLDEAAGSFLLLAGARDGTGLPVLVAAFILFRLLDVLKPPPIRQLERLPGGFGILFDDLAAAAVAAAATWVA